MAVQWKSKISGAAYYFEQKYKNVKLKHSKNLLIMIKFDLRYCRTDFHSILRLLSFSFSRRAIRNDKCRIKNVIFIPILHIKMFQ